jgi:hypothetical protein
MADERSCHIASLGTTSNLYEAVNVYFNSFLILSVDRYELLTLLLGKDPFTEFIGGLVDHGVIPNAGQKSLSLLEIEPWLFSLYPIYYINLREREREKSVQ